MNTDGGESSSMTGDGTNIKRMSLKRKYEIRDNATAIAIWSEDIVLDPGNVRHPIRVVMVDNELTTRFDRLVSLPKNCATYIYRVLDHGIPWQHLDSCITLEDVKQRIIELTKGKRLVVYDAWKTIGLFDFTEQQVSRLKVYDLKSSSKSKGPDGEPWSYWDLVREKLGHIYTGKPGNYDAIELTDFMMRIYLKYTSSAKKDDDSPTFDNDATGINA
ncbi:hypothetical protein Ocin01_03919 [Orchesella cincta]|uniref:Uncharacterized protein n=1 Tax=Orchesella cincta TaxID=48709 RepID=A0A1D2NCG6_ORCCI|nr:hypothetical protein Ocin01_03919 [Orchesella cincta]